MALEIIWSVRAEKGFDVIVSYIEKNWTEREVKGFIQESYEFFEILKRNPKMLQSSSKMNLFRGPMNRLTIITYKLNLHKKQIILVNIRGSRRKPVK
jgi:plasmid stabilization system protein ParE